MSYPAPSRLRLPRSPTTLLLDRCVLMFKTSHGPDGKIADALLLDSRLHNCDRRFGQLQSARAAELKISHGPHGKTADALASTHACTTANASVNYSLYVPHSLKSSHRPHGKLTICSLFAGRRCLRLFRHGHDNVFLDQREYSFLCACSCSKVPIAPMGIC
jgi:hypothetical protein